MSRTHTGDVYSTSGGLEISQCVWCRHRSQDGRRCRAFPDGIPAAILGNRHDHRSPYDNDRGIRFEPEMVEIEFVDVDHQAKDAPLSVELALAAARSRAERTRGSAAEDVNDDACELVIDAEALDLAETG